MEPNDAAHRPVFLAETISLLAPRDGGSYADLTVGHGYMAAAIVEACRTTGRLLALDVDPVAVEAATRRLAAYGSRCEVVHGSYAHFGALADAAGLGPFDGAVIDAGGVSREQIMNPDRGLSFRIDAELDMRLNPAAAGPSARDLVATLTAAELARLFRDSGETPRRARRIAAEIVRRRERSPVRTTTDLARIVRDVAPGREGSHEATKVFLALRLAVNDELATLEAGVQQALSCLRPGARLVTLTYHGLEHRMVRQLLRELESGCTCPPDIPVCACGKQPHVRRQPRRPLSPAATEIRSNPSSRSARLHCVVRASVPM